MFDYLIKGRPSVQIMLRGMMMRRRMKKFGVRFWGSEKWRWWSWVGITHDYGIKCYVDTKEECVCVRKVGKYVLCVFPCYHSCFFFCLTRVSVRFVWFRVARFVCGENEPRGGPFMHERWQLSKFNQITQILEKIYNDYHLFIFWWFNM